MTDQISVPDPCGENWNGMPQQGNGRYCSSCSKVVVDFTNKSNEEILAYIRENSGKKVCGTFKKSQLAPADPFIKNQKIVRFLAAALLVFGMTLFSCQSVDLGDPPPPSEEYPELTGVLVTPPPVIDSTSRVLHTMGICTPPRNVPPEVTNDDPNITGDPAMEDNNAGIDTIRVQKPEEPILGMLADPMPEYHNGGQTLMEYIQNTIRYPQAAIDSAIQGTVYVNFVVMNDGSIKNAKVLKGISPECDAEALRVVLNMPKWKPGKQNGKEVNTQMNLPIKFRLK